MFHRIDKIGTGFKLNKLYLENIRTFIKRNYRKDADIDKKIAL